MALLERVATLMRANLNDLVDQAENPEKLIKQVILDMQNQLLQVKTQVAIAIADQHVLQKKQQENEAKAAEWMRRAELAVDKKQDDLARAALERSTSCRRLATNFAQQVADQAVQVEDLKAALRKLEQKLAEAQARADLLIAQHRRSRALRKTSAARTAIGDHSHAAAFARLERRVGHADAASTAAADLTTENLEDRLAALEQQDEIEQLLAEIKTRRQAG
jgi:phage shock protein A